MPPMRGPRPGTPRLNRLKCVIPRASGSHYRRDMEYLVNVLPVALAAAMLATAVWAALTSTRVGIWCLTAALLWLGAASFTASALLGSPFVLVLLGGSLAVAALLAGAYALLGRPQRLAGAKRATPLEISHALNAR